MDENKVDWDQTQHIDRIRQAHAQKVAAQSKGSVSKKTNNESQGQPCRFFQNKSCSHKGDIVTGPTLMHTFVPHVQALLKDYPTQLAIAGTSKNEYKKSKTRAHHQRVHLVLHLKIYIQKRLKQSKIVMYHLYISQCTIFQKVTTVRVLTGKHVQIGKEVVIVLMLTVMVQCTKT